MKKKTIILIILLCILIPTGCSKKEEDNGLINYMEAKEKIINEGAIMVDVRTKEEYDSLHIAGAELLELDSITEEKSQELFQNKDQVIIVYCQSGIRSAEAKEKLESLGYTNVYDFGSINNWTE